MIEFPKMLGFYPSDHCVCKKKYNIYISTY